jgi:hypothetical protein
MLDVGIVWEKVEKIRTLSVVYQRVLLVPSGNGKRVAFQDI